MAFRDWITGAVAASSMAVSPAMIVSTSQQTGIPTRALQAYIAAAAGPEACPGMRWQILGGIYARESNHGRYGGAKIGADGMVLPAIRNSESGAMGAGQFIPSSWVLFGGGGNPDDIDDSSIATVRHICSTHGDLLGDHLRSAIVAYYGADQDGYADGVLTGIADFDKAGQLANAPAPNLADRFRASWRSLVAAAKRLIDEPVSTVLHDHDMGPVATGRIVSVHGIEVDEAIAPQVRDLLAAADGDGITLGGSGWRSAETQRQLRIRNGCPDVDVSPSSSCDTPTAIPGTSNHETGQAIDFYDGNGVSLSYGSAGYEWLDANAARFGLHNLPSEPWHWSVDGR